MAELGVVQVRTGMMVLVLVSVQSDVLNTKNKKNHHTVPVKK
jgi:hypothetical protein